MKRLFGVMALMSAASAVAATTISNVSLTQDVRNGQIKVDYTLGGDAAIVTCEFLADGALLDEASCTRLTGDINAKVAAGDRSFSWMPSPELAAKSSDAFSVKLRAWSPSTPPDYMVVNLVATNDVVRYYVSTNALPMGGLANDIYRKFLLVMRRIPAKGVTWTMGSSASEGGRNSKRETRHEVTFTNDYWMGIYPVTSRQYSCIWETQPLFGYWATNNVNDSSYCTAAMRDLRPQTNVSHKELRGSVQYKKDNGASDIYTWPQKGHDVTPASVIGKIRRRTGIAFDLPTDAQWEFACRAGTSTAFFFGNAMVPNGGWTSNNTWPDGKRSPHPVGLTLANAYGLYDLYGNVLETCLDKLENNTDLPTYEMPETPVTEPKGIEYSSVLNIVQRGGCYSWGNDISRSAYRERCNYDWAGNERGFRLWAPID